MSRRAALVILNHDDADNTERLCARAAECPDLVKIIVADNSAVRCPAETLPEKAELFPVSNNGYARGNDEAVERLEAEGGGYDYLVIANPDVAVTADAISACFDFLDSHPGFAAAAPHMRRLDGSPHPLAGWREKTFRDDLAYSAGLLSRLMGIGREVYPPEHWKGEFSEADCLAGSFFAVRYAVFRQVGGFDPNTFLYYEEDILGAKLRRLGLRLAVLNRVSFTHLEGASVNRAAGLARRFLLMQRSRVYYRTHYGGTGKAGAALLWAAALPGLLGKLIRAAALRIKGRAASK